MSLETFGARVALLGLAFAAVDLLLGNVVLVALGHGGRLEVLPGVNVVGLERRGTVPGWSVAALAVGGLVGGAACARPGLRGSLWAPVGLLAGAGGALVVDSLDGRVTRWIDLPLWSPLNPADVAMVVAGLLITYAVGVALGGGAGADRRD
jgi:hypothetical protein